MEKYNLLLQIKPPSLQSKYLSQIVNKSDIIFTHKILELEFKKEKKIMQEKTEGKGKDHNTKEKSKSVRKKGGKEFITLVF